MALVVNRLPTSLFLFENSEFDFESNGSVIILAGNFDSDFA